MNAVEHHGLVWESSNKATQEAFDEAERQLRVRLPESYKNFLLATNGGSPRDSVCFKLKDDKTEDETILNIMYGLVPATHEPSILQMASHLPQFRKNNLLLIGDDDFNGKICLYLDEGTVHYFEWSPGPGAGRDEPFDLADSFEEFLDSLWADHED
jgi:hypothetical protein